MKKENDLAFKVTGAILAGGKSSRMGSDKAFLAYSGRPLIETVIDSVSALTHDMMIVTNTPAPYKKYGIKIHGDIIKDRGPLGGIYTALIESNTRYILAVGCDMPFLNRDLLRYMLGSIAAHEAVVPERDGRPEPLCAVYSKMCVEPIRVQLLRGNCKVTDFFDKVKVRILTREEIAPFDPEERCFINVNTPDDYRSISGLITNESDSNSGRS